MKTLKLYTNMWQVFPFGFDMYQYDAEGRYIKELILENVYCSQMKVSEMNLKIKKLSAFDSNGNEHAIADFSGKHLLKIKGMCYGNFIRSTSILLLGSGSYSTLRFYLGKSDNSLVYSDGSEEKYGCEFLDFNIENGLVIKGNESPEAIMRFNLEPFNKGKSFVKQMIEFFKRFRVFRSKLANSFSQ